MRKTFTAALLAATPMLATAVPYAPIPPFAPVYETKNAAITDNLYTLNLGEVSYAQSVGYGPYSTPFYVERFHQATSTPLERWYGGSPQTEHVYNTATYPQDTSNVISYGYTHEGQTGEVYKRQMPGSVPLYRVAWFNPNNLDHMHKFTTSYSEVLSLVASGWTYDHIEGYVPKTLPNAQFPWLSTGFPILPGGHIMTRRCGASSSCATGDSWRDNYYGYKTIQSTDKGSGTTQVMSFDLMTPDLFTTTANEHIAIGLHGHHDLDYSNIGYTGNPARNHHAYGIIFGATDCGIGSVQVEVFTPIKSGTMPCDVQARMHNNGSYHFTISVSDSGQLDYVVTDNESHLVIAQARHQATVDFSSMKIGFPSTDTGYFIVPSTTGQVDYTVYMSNFSVTWQ